PTCGVGFRGENKAMTTTGRKMPDGGRSSGLLPPGSEDCLSAVDRGRTTRAPDSPQSRSRPKASNRRKYPSTFEACPMQLDKLLFLGNFGVFGRISMPARLKIYGSDSQTHNAAK